MGGALGALAGGGMLLLVGWLICAFGHEMGWLSRDKCRWLGRCFLIFLFACIIYRLIGALLYFAFYGPVGDLTEYNVIFRTLGLEKMYELLKNPQWEGLLTGLFAYLGHGIGKMLFGQYLLGGEVAAFLCTFAGGGLLLARLQHIFGKKTGEEVLFLFLCLPFSVFLFLPGWAPIVFFFFGLVCYFPGKLLPKRRMAIPSSVLSLLIALFSLLSAAFVYGLATGRMM